jgi:hypothetical protein
MRKQIAAVTKVTVQQEASLVNSNVGEVVDGVII